MYVDLKNVDLSHVHPSDFGFKPGKSVSINLIRSRDFGVFGHVTLTYLGGYSVEATYGYDKYDFEMHSWFNPLNWPRNAETIIGSPGSGIPYYIYLRGRGTITSDPEWMMNFLKVFDVPKPY